MTDSMVERVERASFACWRKRMTKLGLHMDKGQTFEDMSESEREFARIHARAVIAAMQPSDDLLRKGIHAFQHTHYGDHYLDDWRAFFAGVIAAALEET